MDEEALAEALRDEKIAGAAADVFAPEPATRESSALVKASGEEWCRGKTVLSPHVAWCAQSSTDKLRRTVQQNVEGWARGQPVNVIA